MIRKKINEIAIKNMIGLQSDKDTESAHLKADVILCDLLTALGYSELVDEYNLIDKWYS